MSGIDIIHGLFANPAAVIEKVSLDRRFGLAFFVVIISVISSSIGWLLIFPQNITPSLFIAILVFGVVFLLLFLLLICGILSIVANFYGGIGKGSFLLAVGCFSTIPYWLMTPVALLLSYLEPEIASSFFFLIRLTFFLWAVGLFTIGIRETYAFSQGKAIATLLTPTVLCVFLIIVAFVLLIGIVAPLIGELFMSIPLEL
jgi:hypothetical protein